MGMSVKSGPIPIFPKRIRHNLISLSYPFLTSKTHATRFPLG